MLNHSVLALGKKRSTIRRALPLFKKLAEEYGVG